jgi:MFS family permease
MPGKRADPRIFYAAFSFLSFLMIGAGIVLPAWMAYNMGGSQLVGLVFLPATMGGVIFAPIAGYAVDRHDRKKIALLGQLSRTFGMMLLGFAADASVSVALTLLVLADWSDLLG